MRKSLPLVLELRDFLAELAPFGVLRILRKGLTSVFKTAGQFSGDIKMVATVLE